MDGLDADLKRFVRGECDPRNFPHSEHLRMGFEMLRRHDFAESALHYSQALRHMAAAAGRPEAFHQTITIAFLSLISERMLLCEKRSFREFQLANADLFEKGFLARHYRSGRLASDNARKTFLLPDLGI